MSYFASILKASWFAAMGAAEDMDGWVAIGSNPAVGTTPEIIWSGAGPYTGLLFAPQAMTVVSTSPDDALGGTGLQKVFIRGLDASWNEVEEEKELQGTTPVPLTNPLVRCNAMWGGLAGSGQMNAGDITLEAAGGEILAFMLTGDSWARQAVYTIPDGYRGAVVGASFSTYGKEGRGTLRGLTKNNVWVNAIAGSMPADGSGSLDLPEIPLGLNERTAVTIWAQSAGGGAEVFGVFGIFTVKLGAWPFPAQIR